MVQTHPRSGDFTEIKVAGISVRAVAGGLLGGFIWNPQRSEDQNISPIEVLYVDPTGPASIQETETTVAIQPGGYYFLPPNSNGILWANAKTAGHRFTAVAYTRTPIYPPIPIPALFPPAQANGLIDIRPSYLYQEYSDDSDLQDFVEAYNNYAQTVLNTMTELNLPIYTSDSITGTLLDWVAEGAYGILRPALSTRTIRIIGSFNTAELNTIEFDDIEKVNPGTIFATSDDLFKRIITWHVFKGDGKVFNVKWLKQRIMRFLIGENGSAPNVSDTSQISVTFGANYEVAIRFVKSKTTVTGGCFFDTAQLNTVMLNEVEADIGPISPLPYIATFKEAADSGVLELPFQFTWDITV